MSFWGGRKVLITGASGLVGSHLLERLVELGCDIRATVHQNSLRVHETRLDVRRGDLRDPPFCREVVRDREYVFHCAAFTTGAYTAATTPMEQVTPNIVMNAYLFEACYEAGVQKVVWLSSTTGYPDTGDRAVIEEDLFKGEPHPKYFFVGWMKRYSEILAQTYSEKLSRKMPIVVLRPTNVYGEWDKTDPLKSHVVPALIRRVAEHQNPLIVWGNGHDVRDLIHVSDMVDAILLAVERINGYCPLNIGLGHPYSVREIVSTLVELEPYHPTVRFDATKPTMIPVRRVDVSKAAALLGFRAKVGVREGLARTLSWYKRTYVPVNAT